MMTFAIVGSTNETVVLEITCVGCGKPKQLTVTCEQARELLRSDRRNIQWVLPDVPPAERELLISGTCGDCWKELFATVEEES